MKSLKVSSLLLSCVALYASAVSVPDVMKEEGVKIGTHVEMEGRGAKIQEVYAKFPSGSSISAFHKYIPGKGSVIGERGNLHIQGDSSSFDATAIHDRTKTADDFAFDKFTGAGNYEHDKGFKVFGDVRHIPKLDTTTYNAGVGVNLYTSQDKTSTLDWTVAKSFGDRNDFNTFLKFRKFGHIDFMG